MSIFGNLFGKKSEGSHRGCRDMSIVDEPACDCSGGRDFVTSYGNGTTVVKVMGTGCKKCHQLYENTLAAAERIDAPIKVEYVTDIAEIATTGVMSTPALLVDGKVVSTGKVLSTGEVEEMLR